MIGTEGLTEIRWHGRGGQGAVTSAEVVARAAIDEGKYAQAFPSFGAERRGAPVVAFVRINQRSRIRIRAEILEPDVVVVLDPSLLRVTNVMSGMKPRGILVLNTPKDGAYFKFEFDLRISVATVDANRIAQQILGVPIVNTSMVGALLKAVPIVRMESLIEPLRDRFGRLADKNIEAMKMAYEMTVLEE